jgi:hypothetical protein
MNFAFQKPILVVVFAFLSYEGYAQNLENIDKQEPFKIRGSVNAKMQFYNTDKENPNRDPFVWYLQGSPEVSIYGVVLPFSFRISKQDRDFSQPFNEFGVSPYYKWVQLHLGYRSLTWSNYALAGHSISGAGFELTPGKFRVGFVTGRLLKPIKYIDDPNYTSTQSPAFKRTGSAFIFGYGTEDNYANLVILKAKDDRYSLDTIPEGYDLTPAENLVVSLITKQVIVKKIIFELEVAQSLYTDDTRSAISDSSVSFMAKASSFLMDNRASTSSHNALTTSLGYQSDLVGINVKYQRIEPDFTSMGAYYFLTDISNITLEPSLKLLKKKLSLGGSFGLQYDNLGNDKNLRTKRTITSAKVNYVPVPQFSVGAFFSNYGIAQESGIMSIDTLRESEVAQATSQYGINSSYAVANETWSHNAVLNLSGQKLNDKNSNTSEGTEFSTVIFNLGYYTTYLPWNLNGSVSFMYTNITQDTTTTLVIGPAISLGKTLLENKMSIVLSYSAMANKVDQKTTNTINNIAAQLMYKPHKNHKIALRYYHNINNGKNSLYSSYYENKLDVDYTYTF